MRPHRKPASRTRSENQEAAEAPSRAAGPRRVPEGRRRATLVGGANPGPRINRRKTPLEAAGTLSRGEDRLTCELLRGGGRESGPQAGGSPKSSADQSGGGLGPARVAEANPAGSTPLERGCPQTPKGRVSRRTFTHQLGERGPRRAEAHRRPRNGEPPTTPKRCERPHHVPETGRGVKPPPTPEGADQGTRCP